MIPPTTFAESERALALRLAAGAGICIGLGLVGMVWILWQGGWSEATAPQRLGVLSMISLGGLAGMIAVIIGLLLGGPVGRVKVSVSKDGASAEADDDESKGT